MLMKILLRWIGYALCLFGFINWFCSHLGFPILENKLIWIASGLIGGTIILLFRAFSLGKEEEDEEVES